MRRMITLGLGLAMFGAALGCNHTAGMCDCEGPRQPCMTAEAGGVIHEAPPPMMHAEPIKESPKNLDK